MYAPRTIVAVALAACWFAAGSPSGWAADVQTRIDPDLLTRMNARPAADTARDASRKPLDTLAFAAIQPGTQVAELIPGGGYYTRLLSMVVGAGGKVYALASPPRDGSAPAVAAIAADARYGNVTVLPLSYTERALGLPQPVNVVWTSNNYHDIRNSLDSAGMQAFNQRVFEALQPGGVYLILDHAAAAGRGAEDSRSLHRIDPETVKAEVTAAGFRFAGSSDALRNPDDPHTASVTDAGIRGKTDQFILKFVRP